MRVTTILLAGLLATSLSGLAAETTKPADVTIVKEQNVYQLRVNGKPFTVKGAGTNWKEGRNLAALAQAGGNTFRTWSPANADKYLEEAQKLGLMVVMGFDLKQELHGFDYNDQAAVAAQFAKAKAMVDKYKNHPNLLAWAVANEPNLAFADNGSRKLVNPKVYDAIGEIIDYIHKVDPHHPATYTFAGISPEEIAIALKHTPQVDFISVQVYADLERIPELIASARFDKPFMITEFGAVGHWERPTTAWGREIEEPSGIKAASLARRIQTGIANNPTGKDIGHFAFIWGQKQERTPTWYGMFNKDGTTDARIDELTKFWTGSYPANRAPLTTEITLNQQQAEQSVIVAPGSKVEVQVVATDPEKDSLRYEWVLLNEVQTRSQGGAFEAEPDAIQLHASNKNDPDYRAGKLNFSAPTTEGDYRLFAYVYDGKGKVGNANFPFYVKAKH